MLKTCRGGIVTCGNHVICYEINCVDGDTLRRRLQQLLNQAARQEPLSWKPVVDTVRRMCDETSWAAYSDNTKGELKLAVAAEALRVRGVLDPVDERLIVDLRNRLQMAANRVACQLSFQERHGNRL